MLFEESDAADSLPKAVAACRNIARFNSQIVAEPHASDLIADNAGKLLGGVELILDGTDNFETRYLINDWAVKNSTPWIYVAAVGSYAATMNVIPGQTACLSCIFPEAPGGVLETCDTAGILNSAVNLAACIAATEALKLLTGSRGQLRRTLLSHDVWQNQRSEIYAGKPNPDCRTCARRDFVHLAWSAQGQTRLCGRDSVQIREQEKRVDLSELSRRLEPHGSVRHNEFVLKFSKDPYEMTLFPDGRAIIKGTSDTTVARSFYARYVGN
jgi:adenylyltransferase/sulfurtransferase